MNMSIETHLDKYCECCGSLLALTTPAGEVQQRHVCTSCHHVAYENPKILVGCIATWGDRVLFMKRATAPRIGYWSIPTGFMEKDETPEEAVMRALGEETHAQLDVKSIRPYMIASIPEISEVYLVYRAQLSAPEFGPSGEADDVALFTFEDMSRDYELAYPEVAGFLDSFYEEHKTGRYGVYTASYSKEAFLMSQIGYSEGFLGPH
jgi:ADP-ribose pyrophosphatase YjhB (NUDIX family)